jgi:hypothetical protein
VRGSWRYNAPAWRQLLLGLLAALLLGASAQAQELRAHNFRIEGGEVVLSDGVYLLNARIDFRLSEAAEDALDNGVPLTFVLQLEVERNRGWWWFDANVLSRNLRYRVRYHALSTRYLVTNVESGETRSFTSKQAALAALGTIAGLPVLEAQALQEGASYEVWLRAALDIDELPAPLKTVAYMSPQWRLVSEWHLWRIEP